MIHAHNYARMVTVHITHTSPSSTLSDNVMLAKPAAATEDAAGDGHATLERDEPIDILELTKLLLLKSVQTILHLNSPSDACSPSHVFI